MAQQTAAIAPTPKDATEPSDLVRVRVLHRICTGIQRDARGIGIAEITHKPGEVVEMPRAQAEQLAGRSFEGYAVVCHENGGVTCAPMPHPTGGKVRDPAVQILGE